jgi:hypothetical protein
VTAGADDGTARCAVGLPNVGIFGDPHLLVELAVLADQAGWDGVFLWDHVLYHDPDWPVVDPTVAAAAIAARTRRVRIGLTMVAVPRRDVGKLARETASLDVLSGGRVIMGPGWVRCRPSTPGSASPTTSPPGRAGSTSRCTPWRPCEPANWSRPAAAT